ncbi:RNA pyrophosphohydrolase [Caulobacter sp. KR2-114]|uniref:RNA pyrophosphohydrolase n=1 Tax=Caulobacter sp. KR2-114 TaxID=3400912 RepID=UPI003C0C8AAA
MSDKDLRAYRPNVGVVLIRPDGKVWLGRRARTPGPLNWQFPQGGVDGGETLEEAAFRELAEETGVTSAEIIGRTEGWIAYAFPADHGGSKAARGWKGQKQAWFAMRFTGEDSEIDLEAHGEVEFDAWRWVDLDSALETVVAFKRAAYEQVIAAFRPLTLSPSRPGAPPAG